MQIKKRLYIVLIALMLVVLAGSTGYYLIFGGQPKFMDCVYMTVISLTTVGYGEVLDVSGNMPAQLYTMILIIFGMGVLLYAISTLTAAIVEGELSGILRKKQMEKRIAKLNGHYIVCGIGHTGRHVLTELLKNQEQIVLIEQDRETIERCRSLGDLFYVNGDATDDANLIAAGIERAAGIIICLPSDKDTLYVTMTARMINPTIRIISSMTEQAIEPKLVKAGADKVVSPNFIGGLRMASEMIRPTVVDFLDHMLRSRQGNIRIHEIQISKKSPVHEKKISESGIRDKYDLLVLAVKGISKEIEFNPSPQDILEEGMTLIVMGDVDNIAKAKAAF